MSISVNAVYENGVLRLEHPVELPDRVKVHVIIEREQRPVRTPLGERLRELRARIQAMAVTRSRQFRSCPHPRAWRQQEAG